MFVDLGITNFKELDWWDSVNVKSVKFNFTPVQHWSVRGLGKRSQAPWGGGAVFGPVTPRVLQRRYRLQPGLP